jgi:hypothetical protein
MEYLSEPCIPAVSPSFTNKHYLSTRRDDFLACLRDYPFKEGFSMNVRYNEAYV